VPPYTAIRWGEAVGLGVRDVEFLRRRLNVNENAVQLGVSHAVGPSKGRKARSVPVPPFVLDDLSVQCRGKAPGDPVSPGPDAATCRGRSRQAGGSPKSSGEPRSRRSRPTICGTLVRPWLCRPG
jgi:integrase